MSATTGGYRLFSKGDMSAFWALFTDNLVNLMILSGVCQFVFGMDPSIVYGRIVPGAAIAILAGVIAYTILAKRLAAKEGRDVTALPYGISTPVMFVYLFGVIGPIYWSTGDSMLAWQVGIGAGFVGGIVAALGALIGPWIKRITPRAGMLGTLVGIALVYIAAVPMAEIFEHPIVGFTSLAIVMWGLVGGFKMPFGLPAGLVALVVGIILALVLGEAKIEASGMGLYLPVPYISDLLAGVSHILANPELLLVLVPVQIYNFIETMNNVESAEAAGDGYPVATAQVTDGIGTMIGAVFGSPFPTTVYIGHPAYKALGANAGYIIAVGIAVALAAFVGFLSFLNGLLPIAAAAPILVFVAISLFASTAKAVPQAHMAAVLVAMLPHVSNFLVTKWGSMLNALRSTGVENLPNMNDDAFVGAMLMEGAHVIGHQTLAQGSIIIGLMWGAIVANIIDAKHQAAAYFCFVAAAMTSVGIIHAPQLQMPVLSDVTIGYVIMAVILILLDRTKDQTA